MIAAAGSTIAPGVAGAIGTLTVTNTAAVTNFSVVTYGGTLSMDINRGSTPNSDKIVSGTNIFGGTLTVNNLGAPLAAGDTFTLFSSTNNSGTFAFTNLPVLTGGLTWNNTLSINGKLTVAAAIPTTPTNLVVSLSGTNLIFSWPTNYTGWRLVVQTNNLAKGVSGNTNDWGTVAGSTGTNVVVVPVNPTNPADFYRMAYP